MRNSTTPAGIRATQLTRRMLLQGSAATAGVGLLAACGAKGTAQQAGAAGGGSASPSASGVADRSDTDKKLVFSNWPEYLDLDDSEKHSPSMDRFEKQSGISVKYQVDINDNEEFYGKVSPQLQAGQSIGRDIVVLTDWMAGRWIQLGWAQKLDKANIPNAKNLRKTLASPSFDPNRDYTLPWQTGMTGIAWNTKSVKKPIASIEQLLTDRSLKGKVTVLSEMADTIGLILLQQGKDPADFSDADFQGAVAMLQKAVDSGQIRQVTGNDYVTALGQGSIDAAIAWSGDVLGDENIEFGAPEAGLMIWSDNMLVPPLAAHKKNAERLMDYYYDPANAALVTAWVNYISPVDGTQPLVAKADASVAKDPLVYPTAATLAKTHIFADIDEKTRQRYSKAFQGAVGA